MEIRAFRGLRYRPRGGSDISDFIAPPYDILSAQGKEDLLARSQDNIVSVDLPHVPPSQAGPDAVYASAERRLSQWVADGVLLREPHDALYAYEQVFTWAGKAFRRRAMICSIRLSPFGKDVLPHEHTFAGPKADRLKLMQHTGVQLSPIFGFFRDPRGAAMGRLWAGAEGRAPDAQGQLAGVREMVWSVTDEQVIRDIRLGLAGEPVFIADGHHRYTTALNYRDGLLAAGKIDGNHPANFVMFALVERSDPAMLILPTHRLIRGLKAGFSVAALAKAATEFSWKKVPMDRVDFADGESIRRLGKHAFALLDAEAGELWIATLTDSQAMRQAAPDAADAWRELDVAILHRLLIEKGLTPWVQGEPTIEYTHDGEAVLAACRSGGAQLGVLLAGTPIEAVEAIARAGAAMPHKSTYFYPKLTTGIVLMPLK
jgi:uncharacterized protein (DUF1015 family)